MKRITKTTAAFLCFVLLLTFSPCNISSSAEEAASEKQGTSQESIASGNASAEAVFDLEKEVLDWGEGITKVHIKFNEEIDAASVDADTFTVMVGTARRTITRIEVLGSEVIITMKSGQNTLGINSPISNYVIAQNAPFKTSTGSEINVGSIAYVPGDEYNAQTAKFTYHTSQSGMNYRMYSPPAEEGKEYAVLFWLHGYLQGGSDNESQILGNRVTFFASDEIQEKFDGMYVVAPQNPEDEQTWSWMQTDETGRSSSLPVLISL
jgi:predicted peptidase